MTEPTLPAEGSQSSPNRGLIIGGAVVAVLVVIGLVVWLTGSDDSDDDAGGEATVEEIRQAQTVLAAVGCYSGGVDGVAGPETEQAIRDFQEASGLAVDGIVGPNTIAAAEEALAAGQTVCTAGSAGGGSSSSTTTLPPTEPVTMTFTTSGGLNQTLDVVQCQAFEDGAYIVAGQTETSELDVDSDADASGSLRYVSADGDLQGTVDSVGGSGADRSTTFSGDLDNGDTFEVVAPC